MIDLPLWILINPGCVKKISPSLGEGTVNNHRSPLILKLFAKPGPAKTCSYVFVALFKGMGSTSRDRAVLNKQHLPSAPPNAFLWEGVGFHSSESKTIHSSTICSPPSGAVVLVTGLGRQTNWMEILKTTVGVFSLWVLDGKIFNLFHRQKSSEK